MHQQLWLAEEQKTLHGWDFSALNGRVVEGALPWDYGAIVRAHLLPHHQLLDMGTGGGEFLLTLGHPHARTTVTEGYPPNLQLCKERLAPLGIQVEAAADDDSLPFEDERLDRIINRHDSFDAGEVFRCLKPGGLFITQQVGGENNRALSQRLLPDYEPPYAEHNMRNNARLLREAGFELVTQQEAFPMLRFLDIGALVYFAKVIPWEFPGFSVARCLPVLEQLQAQLDAGSPITSKEHRFLLVAQKPQTPTPL